MKNKNKYCYLVYCNPKEPLVYAVYSNKKSALKYANQLIEWRLKNARNNKYIHGFYHYVTEEKLESPFDKREKLIFSVCLRIEDNKKDYISDNACLIKVIRKLLQK